MSSALREARISHRIVGGVAVFLHVDAVEPIAARLTPDVDVAIQPDGFAAASRALESLGYQPNGYTFHDPANWRVWRDIHLIFESAPVRVCDEQGVLIAPVADLVQMKLTSFRLKDKVHIQDMDSVRLITPEIEAGLSEPLRVRLAEVRASK